MNNNLKELIDYCKQQDPIMWGQAKKEVKEWSDKVKLFRWKAVRLLRQ